MPTPPVAVAGRANRALDTLHSMLYFAPEQDEELAAIGLRPGRMAYFASRSAAMGAVSGPVTAATFYNFNPVLVAKYIPRAWTLAPLEDILAARLRAADRLLRRLVGPDIATDPQVLEAAELARRAATDLPGEGRPLFAGHAGLPWPDEPHLVLWHAITLLREYRGDGHIAALVQREVPGLEALISHVASGASFTVPAAKATRGWSDEEWDTGSDALRVKGFLDADGGLTDAGRQLRTDVEADTDRLAAAPWSRLDDAELDRLITAGKSLSRAAIANGAFPAATFSAGRG